MSFHIITKICPVNYAYEVHVHIWTLHCFTMYICVLYGRIRCGATSTNTVQFMRAHLEARPLTCLLTPTHKHF